VENNNQVSLASQICSGAWTIAVVSVCSVIVAHCIVSMGEIVGDAVERRKESRTERKLRESREKEARIAAKANRVASSN
jgi:hypothetical protein